VRRIANGEWRIGMNVERADQLLSGFEGLAGRNVSCRILLSADQRVSTRGDVRYDISNPPSCFVDPREYRRRARTRGYAYLYTISADRPRLPKGSRDASATRREGETYFPAENRSGSRWLPAPRPHASSINSPTREKDRLADMSIESPYSLFATRYSRIT